MRRAPAHVFEAALIAAVAITTNCVSGDDLPTFPPVTAANIAIVSGDGQTGVITLTLAQPLVVKVTNDAGAGVAGFQVRWSVTSGGGTLPVASVTGSDGTATAQWVLGPQVGAATATAGNPELTGATKTVTFGATAIGASVALESGSGQSGFTGDRLASDFVVKVTDTNGSPVAGKTILWSVTSGGGSLSPVTSLSRGDGLASTRYTLGSSTGSQTVEAKATAFTNSPIAFAAQAQQRPLGAQVSVGDNFFAPATATISAGNRVAWNWEGFNQHNVTWINAPASNANSATQQSGVHEVSFLNTGTFEYYCSIHATATSGTMRGSIVVN